MLEILRNPPPVHEQRWDWEALRREALATSLNVLRSPADAEDAAQEAILRAWRARGRCEATTTPYPWVGQIARNEALRLGARLTQRRETEFEALGDVRPAPTSDGAAAGDARALAMIDVIRDLPARDAELVRLRYVEDLQYSTIAERLDMPLGTVKVCLHRLHKRLRKLGKP